MRPGADGSVRWGWALRDLAFFVMVIGALPMIFLSPHLGVLLWSWFSISNIHRELYGFAIDVQYNLIIAALTFLAYFISTERKRIPITMHTVLLGVLAFWMTASVFTAISTPYSMPLYDRHIKTLALLLFILLLINSRTRIHSLVLMMCLAIGYWGVKGGAFAILTAGQFRVYGPDSSPIYDNNHIALALCVAMPLMNYLRVVSRSKLMRYAALGVMLLSLVAVLATYSRGGFIALMTLLVLLWWKAPHKILTTSAGLIGVMSIFFVLPQGIIERLGTMSDVMKDASFLERLEAWQASLGIARDYPIFGGGFSATEIPSVFLQYAPGTAETLGRAVHSIYFQVLSDLGFAGLALYLSLFVIAFLHTGKVIRLARGRADLKWAHTLADMMQISLIVFLVGGAGLSMAYYDLALVIVFLTGPLLVHVREELRRQGVLPAMGETRSKTVRKPLRPHQPVPLPTGQYQVRLRN